MAALASRAVPRARGLFILGNTLQYLRDPLTFMADSAQAYGDIVQFRFPGLSAVQLTHPDQIEQVLRHDSRHFQKDWITRDLKGVVGEGLLTSEGDFWRRQRRLSQPAFLQRQVLEYVPTFVDFTARSISAWQAGETRDVHVDFTQLTLQIAAKTLFDADVSAEVQIIGDALQEIMRHFFKPAFNGSRWAWLPTPARRRLRIATREIDRVVFEIIRQRAATRGEHGDLLDRLLAAQDADGSRMTDRQLRDEFVTILLAGHETTALTLGYAFFLLAENPDADDRLAREIQQVVGDRPVEAADLPKLAYTEWCIQEAMRIYPPAWVIGRESLCDVDLGNYRIPQGTQIWLPQWVVHRDARWFDEPLEFRPERWDPNVPQDRPRCAYFPFGDGPRVCIGSHFAMAEAIAALATVAQRFRPSRVGTGPLQLSPSITLRPTHGVPLTLHARSRVGEFSRAAGPA